MTIEQTVEIPVNHRLIVDVPQDIPAGKAMITITPAFGKGSLPETYSPEEALKKSAERAAARRKNPSLNTFRKFHGSLKGSLNFDRDGMEIQREMRNEWN
jgi:hypothetical protein